MPIRDYLFNHLEIVDDFISINPYHFTKEELELIHNFKFSISDTFIIMEYDDEFAYLLGQQGNFAIKGLHSTVEEVIPKFTLPFTTPMHLIPFKGIIVYDGIITGPNVELSSRILRQLKKDYRNNTTYYSISVYN